MSTVLVTMMPYWAERMGVPRTLAVEFPYGHPLGWPGDRDMQMAVILAALALLAEARAPGKVRELDYEWPRPLDEAKRDWQPLEPSPIIKMLLEQARQRRESAG